MLCEGIERYIKYFVGFGALLNIILNAVMIPVYGAAGAAMATLITEFASSAAASACFPKTRPYVGIWFGSLPEIKPILRRLTGRQSR